jgi:hypothetical protein
VANSSPSCAYPFLCGSQQGLGRATVASEQSALIFAACVFACGSATASLGDVAALGQRHPHRHPTDGHGRTEIGGADTLPPRHADPQRRARGDRRREAYGVLIEIRRTSVVVQKRSAYSASATARMLPRFLRPTFALSICPWTPRAFHRMHTALFTKLMVRSRRPAERSRVSPPSGKSILEATCPD